MTVAHAPLDHEPSTMLYLNSHTLADPAALQSAGIIAPQFDRTAVAERTADNPTWIHFGAGNLFRCFHAALQQDLLNKGLVDVKPLISATLSYRDSARAFALAADRSRAMKVLLNFD